MNKMLLMMNAILLIALYVIYKLVGNRKKSKALLLKILLMLAKRYNMSSAKVSRFTPFLAAHIFSLFNDQRTISCNIRT